MLHFARTKLDIVAPASDLLYKDAYDVLMDGVTDGFVVGKAVIEGGRCDHLAFRAPHVDLQVWVQEGGQPLPRRFVITTRDLPNAPQFAVTITKWNLKPEFGAQTFSFTPPAARSGSTSCRAEAEETSMTRSKKLRALVVATALLLLYLADAPSDGPSGPTLVRHAHLRQQSIDFLAGDRVQGLAAEVLAEESNLGHVILEGLLARLLLQPA
jgi:hypothetical protein